MKMIGIDEVYEAVRDKTLNRIGIR